MYYLTHDTASRTGGVVTAPRDAPGAYRARGARAPLLARALPCVGSTPRGGDAPAAASAPPSPAAAPAAATARLVSALRPTGTPASHRRAAPAFAGMQGRRPREPARPLLQAEARCGPSRAPR